MLNDSNAQARRKARQRWVGGFLAVVLGFTALGIFVASPVAAVAVAVPYSATPVADVDLDGNPATGAWTDATTATIPLENGEVGAYGSATMYAKHDGTTAYFRIDGSVDVAWVSATGNHFWLGMAVSTANNAHHNGNPWDGWYFGLWNGNEYLPQPTYPPTVVDTNAFGQPPTQDGTQNAVGTMRYAGAAAPYTFTAEWKRALSTGDASDITFTADGVATYYFYVTTDSDGGGSNGGVIRHRRITNSNTIRFNAPVVNTAPTVDLTTPNGGEVWTGGTPHLIRWNMSDAETATASLRVWLNYSTDGGASYLPIAAAQGVTGFTNPCTFSWTVPAANTVQARVRATVADAGSLTATDASLANFAIDSTAPTVLAFTPADGATGVSPSVVVLVDFSEAMNRATAESAFSLMRIDTSTYVVGTFGWAANQLAFTPSAALAQGVSYRSQVNASARDASDPGNPMASVRTATFSTADVTPPAISAVTAVPNPQEAGFPVNVSALVTDNGALAGVWVEVLDPLGTSLGNVSATRDPGTGRYYRDQPYSRPGLHSFTISARDVAGLWAVATGTFRIVDTVPPVITHAPVSQALQNVTIRITATVTDADAVADARIDYTDVLGVPTNASMVLNGTVYEYVIPGQPVLGTLTYFLWAVDPSANAVRTPTYSVSIVAADVTPPAIVGVAAVPPVQDAGLPVNVTATVTDNVAVARVDVVVTDPLGAVLGNFSMARVGATDAYFLERPYATLGNHAVVVWAVDTSANNASATGSFEVVDRIAPVLSAVAATPSPQEAGLPVNISATVTDNVAVANVQAQVYDPSAALVLDIPMLRAGSLFWIAQPYVALGTYTFTLTARDPSGNVATDGGSFAIVDTQPPVANAGPDRLVPAGTLVAFDGSGSTDNGGIVNYTWTFSDPAPVSLYGVSPSYTFSNLGSFLVTLTVRDAAGNPDADTAWVNVSSDTGPPVADAGAGQTVLRGTVVTLDGTGSTDDTGIVAYTWTFLDPGPVTLSGATVTHRFLRVANVTITLTVRDAVGQSDTDTTWVNVRPDLVPPVANAGPDQTINLGSPVSLDGSASTDNVEIVAYDWQVQRTGQILSGAQVTFTPNAGGVWQVVLTVRDPSGLSATDDVNVTVLVEDHQAPSPPLGLTAETHDVGAIRLTWTASPEPDVAGYYLYRSATAEGPFIRINLDPLTDTTYVDAGLEPGRRYWYEVRAVDGAGNVSGPSDPADAVAGAAPPEPFGWSSMVWILVPLIIIALLAVLVVLATRRRRREEEAKTTPPSEAPPAPETPKAEAPTPSPPTPAAPPASEQPRPPPPPP